MKRVLLQMESGDGPKYRRIADQLIGQIRSGVWKPGERLPGERAFAKQLGLSVATTVAVMNDLEQKGYAVRRRGSGTYVANSEPLQRPRIAYITELPHVYNKRIFGELWNFCYRNNCDLLPLFRTVDQLESAVAEYWLDGLLVYNQGEYSLETIRRINEKGIPLFLLSAVQSELSEFSFGYSNEELIHDAVAYLVGLGHTAIGFLTSRDDIIPNRFRRECFLKSMWEQRIPVNPSWIITSGLTEAGLKEYFASPERPGAVIIGNCSDQPLIAKALRESALEIPRELSVLVMDENMVYTQSSGCEYTRFRINVTDFSTQGAEYLLRKIRGEAAEKPYVRNYEFVEAGTCAPPMADEQLQHIIK